MNKVLLTALVLMLTGCAWDYQSLGTGTAQVIAADRVLATGLPQAQIRLANLSAEEDNQIADAERLWNTLADKWADYADQPEALASRVSALEHDFGRIKEAYIGVRGIAAEHQEEYAPMIWGNLETYDAGAKAIDGNFTRFIDSANAADAHGAFMQYLQLASQLGMINIPLPI